MRPALLANIACLALLAACAPRPPEVPKEAQAQIDLFAQPWLARGTEPFWSVRVERGKLTFERPDQSPLEAAVSTRGLTTDSAAWLAQAATGEVLALSLARQPCSDGMSDLKYAWSASLKVGVEELRGCAGPAAALKAQPHG